MKKVLIVAACVVVVLAIALSLGLWWVMNRSLYQPGQVRALSTLAAPLQTGGQYWDVEQGVRLYHFAEGEGKNLLFVHGGPGFPPVRPAGGLSRLAGTYRTNYYHQRGCGKSTRPVLRLPDNNYFQNLKILEAKLGLGAQVADIERIRQILGEEKLTLVGHSFGAFLASLYAAEFPERVRGMVLVAPATVLVMPNDEPDLYETVGRLLPAASKPGYDDFRKRYFDFRTIFQKSDADLRALNAEFVPYYQQAVASRGVPVAAEPFDDNGGWMVQAMYFSMGRRHDFRPGLQAVKAPVLVIHCENDLQTQTATEVYVKAFRNARLAKIKNSVHTPFIEQPDEFASVVGSFLAELK